MRTALVNARILTHGRFNDGLALIINGSRIESLILQKDIAADLEQIDLAGALLAPGMVDIQVNGGNGKLFNDSPTVETIRHIAQTHRKFGTTSLLPTLISDDLDAVEAAITAVDSAIKEGVPGVLGIHIEGPFLSTDRKGVHDSSKFRTLQDADIALLTSLRRGKTLLTIAPERITASQIARLTEAGVILSVGHTNATFTQTLVALESGMTGFTHLFNAMSPLTGREPGVVGAALDHQDSWCGIIVDGQHVSNASLRIALRCKSQEKFMLVTDAMPSVGMRQKTFQLHGRTITVKNGVCVTETGTLAGSDLHMRQALINTVEMLNINLVEALQMASLHPAQFLGLNNEIGRIAPGLRANLIALDDELNISKSWVDGQMSTHHSNTAFDAISHFA